MRDPPALVGLTIIIILVTAAVWTVITIPYDQAVTFWRPEQIENYRIPEMGQPAWTNFFRRQKLPETIIQDSRDGTAVKEFIQQGEDTNEIDIEFSFDYASDQFPEDVNLYLTANYAEKRPFVTLTWRRPDGSETQFRGLNMYSDRAFRFAIEARDLPEPLKRGMSAPMHILFADPSSDPPTPLSGTYTLSVNTVNFERDADFEAELVIPGKVYGMFGSDAQQRDLKIPLLWGIPIALAFGLFGAVSASLITMVIAAVSAWYGGWVDNLVQRVTEINLILPTLPIAITVFYLYSKSVWVILGVFVLLSVFSTGVKNYRAIFLQAKEAPYIEAARSYGASNWRIITRYLIPRILPVWIPQMIILTPTFVFLEATLAYLGVSDHTFPTWGKVILDGLMMGALENKQYYLVVQPVALLIITGVAFALLGYALDNTFNPRLKRG